jgi:tetratricopeptide (TPR) repeat protein
MRPRHFPLHCALLALSILCTLFVLPAAAQSNEQDFKALIKERKFAELEKLATERTAKDNKDDVAWWYLSRFGAGDQVKRDALIPKLEKCIAELPESARCHHALGAVFGSSAMSAGMVNGIKYAGKIKDMFVKAVELDPNHFDMRRDLGMFYLQAPGIVGGSVRKARANADDFAKLNPAQAQLLRADIHIYEKEFDQADKVLASIKPAAGDDALSNAISGAFTNLGFSYINDKKPALAVALFERRIVADMNNAVAHFGLGRAHLENGAIDLAIAALEKALVLDPRTNAHYRLGIAYQTKGDKSKAIAAFQQFITYGSGKALDDAKARLDTLKKSV